MKQALSGPYSAIKRAGTFIVGISFCTLNIVLLLFDCILISPRFYRRPGSFTYSFTDQVELLFILEFARQRTVKLHTPLTSAILA